MEEPKKNNTLNINDTLYQTQLTKKYKARKPYTIPDPKKVYAIIPGVIRDINIKTGQTVKDGDKILILEAMKMKNILLSHRDGKIKEIKVESGDMVFKNQVLAEFE